jgi:hypothetical protein
MSGTVSFPITGPYKLVFFAGEINVYPVSRVEFLGKKLEEAFFHPMNMDLVEQFRQRLSLQEKLDAFSNTTGIRDRKQLIGLANMGYEVSTLTAFTWIPLVFVAWADGRLDDLEKKSMIEALVNRGISRSTAAMMTDHKWFRQQPEEELWELWAQFARSILGRRSTPLRNELLDEILTRCHVVANASGFQQDSAHISAREWEVIERVTDSLHPANLHFASPDNLPERTRSISFAHAPLRRDRGKKEVSVVSPHINLWQMGKSGSNKTGYAASRN